MLPDYKTLLFWDDLANNIVAARRTSTVAGDQSFEVLPGFAGFDGAGRGSDGVAHWFNTLTLTCDQQHILYVRTGADSSIELRVVEILSLDPLTLATSELLPGPGGQPYNWRVSGWNEDILWAAESLDCKNLYISERFNFGSGAVDPILAFAAPRVPCN
jgi:hypothetical protein